MIDKIGFFEVSAMSAILPLIVGLLMFRKLGTPTLIILSFIFISLLIDGLNFQTALSTGDNSKLINVYVLIQTILVGLYFVKISNTSTSVKRWHAFLVSGALIGIMITYLLSGSLVKLNIRAVSVSSMFVLLHCGFYFIDLMQNHIEDRLAANPNFFITTSLFVYHSCVITVFLTFDIFDFDISEELWHVKLVAYILFNIFIVFAIMIEGNQLKNIES